MRGMADHPDGSSPAVVYRIRNNRLKGRIAKSKLVISNLCLKISGCSPLPDASSRAANVDGHQGRGGILRYIDTG